MDESISRVQFGNPRNFWNPIISKLGKNVVLLHIHYMASKNKRTWQIFDSLKYRNFSKFTDEFGHWKTQKKTLRAMIARWRLKKVIIAAVRFTDIQFINLSWHLIGWWRVSRFSSNRTVCSNLRKCSSKNYPIYLNLDIWQKLIKIDLLAILHFDATI